MSQHTLKPCPCGNTPEHLVIADGCQGGKYNYATGSCCGEWIVEFRANYRAVDSDECVALAVAAWNASPRATPQAAVPDDVAREALSHIAEIAHAAGLVCAPELEVLAAIRKLSRPWWNKNGTLNDMRDRAEAAMLAAQQQKEVK